MRAGASSWVPLEIFVSIFARLPVRSIMLCRCVCRTWRSILASEAFLEHWSQSSKQVPWFLLYQDPKFVAYDPINSIKGSIPFDPPHLELPLAVVASAGGLICLSSQEEACPLLLVCNPLCSSCKILPKLNQINLIYIMGMAACPTTNSYKVLVTGIADSSPEVMLTEVYDSSSQTWLMGGASEAWIFQDFSGMRAVFYGSSFYCLSEAPYQLIAYDMKASSWKNIQVQSDLQNLDDGSLFVCQGRLLMAGRLAQEKKKFQVWELGKNRVNWSEVRAQTGPLASFLRALQHFMNFQCSEKEEDYISFNSWCSWNTLMYDIDHNAFKWMPAGGRSTGGHVIRGLTYEPDFLVKP